MLASTTFRRTTATTARLCTSFKTKTNPTLYQPLLTPRFFRTTAKMGGVHNIANKADFDAAIKNNKVVVVDFFATWCGPCKVIAPQLVKYSEEYADAYFIKLDVDEVPDVAQELGIRAMPTFFVYKDGEKSKEVVGANPPAIKAAIEAVI